MTEARAGGDGRGGSGGLDAVGVDMVGADQHPPDADALPDQVDGGAVEVEAVEAALVALEGEAAADAAEQARLVDRTAGQSVASIVRAAWSGSSAWVIGRPMTRIDAPWSSA